MSSDIVAAGEGRMQVVPTTFGEQMKLAEVIAQASGMIPDQYAGKPANILVAMQYGATLGLDPMAALQNIDVVKGRPSLSAKAMLALLKAHGYRVRFTKDERAQAVTCTIIDPADPDEPVCATWDMAKARQAKLSGDNWVKYPMTMLKWRALTEAAREAAPQLFLGLGGAYTRDELADEADTAPAGRVRRRPYMPRTAPEPEETEACVVDETDDETGERAWSDEERAQAVDRVCAILREAGVHSTPQAVHVLGVLTGAYTAAVADLPDETLMRLLEHPERTLRDAQEQLQASTGTTSGEDV